MRRWIFSLAVFLVLALAVSASAQGFPQYQDDYVNDFAHVFTAGEVSHLRSVLASVRENTTAEVVLVTVETAEPTGLADYATELFTRWGIGKKGKDNGLLLIYAKNESKFRAVTGYGIEGILPDSKLGRMLDDYYVPYRDAGNVSYGIILFTEEVSKVIKGDNDATSGGTGSGSSGDFWLAMVFIIIAILFIILPFIVFAVIIIVIFVKVLKLASPKCKKDGLRMKFVKTEGEYDVYECPNGHRIKKKRKSQAYAWGGAASGGFAGGAGGGGGFGGGGGGFGGGGTGGGGAGR
jgi:uncharacterized protein